jgi:isopentenyldiphosphate isomerase
VFEIYDADCNLLGRELRAKVHKEGLLHKAAYCFVFDRQRRLLVQRRSLKKKIGPGQWDLSVAEHLSPGETHRAGGRGGAAGRAGGSRLAAA